MGVPWLPQNPGIDLNQLTQAEIDAVAAFATLTDPNADRLVGWDDTDNTFKFIVIGSGLTYTHATHTLSGASQGASTALDNLAAVAINASLLPGTDGAIDLGSATKEWGNLFLKTGGVINYANGNVVLTHSSGILTMGTGELRVTNAGTNTASVVTVGGSQTLTSKILTSATITTKLSPTSDDGAPLGDTTHNFSDLFLASGAVINFANSNVTLTHTSGVLTLAGTLALDANNLTLTGSIAATGARVTKGWFTDLESTNDITIGGVALATTYLAKAGGTLTGNIVLGENTSIQLDPAGSADGKYSGTTITGTGGATIAFGDLVTLDKDDSRWELVDISVAAAATGDARGWLGMAVTSSSDGAAITVLLEGQIRADANFPALTIGAAVYASTTGDVVVTQPTTTDYVIRIVGYAMTADEMYFHPGNSWTTHT